MLRQFLMQSFNDMELEDLCFDYFPDVAQDFTVGMTKSQKVRHVIDYLDRRGRLAELHDALFRERSEQYWQLNRYNHEKTGIEIIRIPAGEFLYGQNNEKRSLPEFWIGRTPVTNMQYKRFLDVNPNHRVPSGWDSQRRSFPREKADHPVLYMSYIDAQAFCKWAGLRLPSGSEWEKAARGTNGRLYPWGDNPPTTELCNFDGNEEDTTPVGRYSPQGDSPYGCTDMAGNVYEWTTDWIDWSDHDGSKPLLGGIADKMRNILLGDHDRPKPQVLRGCAWYTKDTKRLRCTHISWSARRTTVTRAGRGHGFRVCADRTST